MVYKRHQVVSITPWLYHHKTFEHEFCTYIKNRPIRTLCIGYRFQFGCFSSITQYFMTISPGLAIIKYLSMSMYSY